MNTTVTPSVLTVQALKFKDVRDKEQLYITIENQQHEKVVINVGEKTYNSVKKLLTTTNETIKTQEDENNSKQSKNKLDNKTN